MKKTKKLDSKVINRELPFPIMIAMEEGFKASSTRRNRSGSIERTDKYKNIEDGIAPFEKNARGNISAAEPIVLCQKAYYNVAIFRSTIDLMTEFSSTRLHFRGTNKKAISFFNSWLKKLNIWSLQDRFFREYYRSGNVVLHRLDIALRDEDIRKLTQTYGLTAGSKVYLPGRYIVLNPADIEVSGQAAFSENTYYKLLNGYELSKLKNPTNDEDKEIFEGLPEEAKKAIRSGANEVVIPLDPSKLHIVFYKKQDYEPFSVPMGYPVLEDLNWKAEMKKMDMALTRSTQHAILLITMGTEPAKGGVNPEAMSAMSELFKNESVQKVLVADYTTQAKFVMPDIASLIDAKKYEQVDKDILVGLNNVFLGSGSSEKFANQSIKVQIFVERLKQAREAFINDFLAPEVKRISKEMGFKNYPEPYFEEINLKDELQFARVYSRLWETGLLTAEETLQAISSGILPDSNESLDSQRKFKEQKEQGFYEPLIGGGGKENGRPEGSSAPQETKTISPIGAAEKYSSLKVAELLNKSQKLEAKVKASLKKKFKLKELNESQNNVGKSVAHCIVANEAPENWLNVVNDYLENPTDRNKEQINKIHDIAYEHQIDDYFASILFHAKI